VLDAPPTGRIGRFLNVNTEVAGIAKVGPVRNHATSIMRLLKSDQTKVHFVTTLEEMPVQESLDGVAVAGVRRVGGRRSVPSELGDGAGAPQRGVIRSEHGEAGQQEVEGQQRGEQERHPGDLLVVQTDVSTHGTPAVSLTRW